MSDTERKKRQRRSAGQQAQDIVTALKKARIAFIAEGDEGRAQGMQEVEVALRERLKPVPEHPDR